MSLSTPMRLDGGILIDVGKEKGGAAWHELGRDHLTQLTSPIGTRDRSGVNRMVARYDRFL